MKHCLSLIFLTVCCSLYGQQTVGLFHKDLGSFNGYTLFSANQSDKTYLIDNCGRKIHSWTSDWKPGLSCYLLENGDLLRAARISTTINAPGGGGRIERYNWDGDLVWGYDYTGSNFQQHHDIEPLPNGNILVLAWEVKTESEALEAGRIPTGVDTLGVYSERIMELEMVGTDQINVVWEWHLWDHLVQDFDSTKNNFGSVSEHPEWIDLNYEAETATQANGVDWIHLNSVDYNADRDEIVVSSRVFNEIWIIDHSTTTEEAATHAGGNSGKGGDLLYRWGNPESYQRGITADRQLFGQHDPNWIPIGSPDEGKIIIYNNGYNRPGEKYSSIEVINPPLDSTGNYLIPATDPIGPTLPDWTYDGEIGNRFYSAQISGVQRLPNGNTLICEGRPGRLFEIDSAKNIVWDYVNPTRSGGIIAQGNSVSQNEVFRTRRYAVDYPAFNGKTLIPGDPLEINPLPSTCQITSINEWVLPAELGINIYPNPFANSLQIDHSGSESLELQIFDSQGKQMISASMFSSSQTYSTHNWSPGIYLIRIASDTRFSYQKLIKL